MSDLVDDEELRAEIQKAIDDANKAVSKAESIRKFAILAADWTEEGGQMTPSLKLKRNVVVQECEDQIADLYAGARRSSPHVDLPGSRPSEQASSSQRRPASRSHRQSRSTQARPAAPSRCRSAGSRSSVTSRPATASTSRPSTT